MDKKQLVAALRERNLDDILELIEDAESGELEELELVESIGLVHDSELNDATLRVLKELGVKIIYVTDE